MDMSIDEILKLRLLQRAKLNADSLVANNQKVDLDKIKLESTQSNTQKLVEQTQNNIIKTYEHIMLSPEQLRMNQMASMDRAVYIKNLLNLPENMVELLVMLQKNAKSPNSLNNPLNKFVSTQPQLQNQVQNDILQQKQTVLGDKLLNIQKNISNQILYRAQIEPHIQLQDKIRSNQIKNQLTQLNNVIENNIPSSQEILKAENAEMAKLKQILSSQLSEKINMTQVSSLILENGKQALNKVIMELANNAKLGMMDTSQIKDTINILNASIMAASQGDSTQTLKNLMLLYLPWLPLQEGVGFSLDVETSSSDSGVDDDSSIKIMITTRNYGNIRAVIALLTGNSVDVFINCIENFPKKELLKRLNNETEQYSMIANFDIEENIPKEKVEVEIPQAKINIAEGSTLNPYLLLMSHSFIRHTIEIDTLKTLGEIV